MQDGYPVLTVTRDYDNGSATFSQVRKSNIGMKLWRWRDLSCNAQQKQMEKETLCWFATLLTFEVKQMHLSGTKRIWNAVAHLRFDYGSYFHLTAESIYIWLQSVFPFTADCVSKCLLQDVYKNVVQRTLFRIILLH